MNKTIEWTLEHPLNRSGSKAAHKFGTSHRFPKPSLSPCIKASYDLSRSAILSPNSAMRNGKFGRDDRFGGFERELSRRSCSPSPNAYQDVYLRKDTSLKAASFARSDKLPFKPASTPGPGAYTRVFNPEAHLSYTMRSRVKTSSDWNHVGPGQYDPDINFLSGKSRVNIKIGRERRFANTAPMVPAPGTYYIDKIKTEQTSKHSQAQNFSFSRSRRQEFKKLLTPGPGTYREFSQFHQDPMSARR